MKPTPHITSLLAVAALGVLPASAQITGFNANFNADASTYTNNFQRWNTDPQDPVGFTWGSSLGTGGGGGLQVDNTAGNNIFYGAPNSAVGTHTFNLAGLTGGSPTAAFSSSIDFVWGSTTATDQTLITFGLASSRSQNAMSSTGSLGGSIIRSSGGSTVTLRLRNSNSTVSSLTFNQSLLTAGSWYQLSFDFTKSATTNEFEYALTLLSLGANGTSTPVVFNDGTKDLTLSGSVTNSTLYGDSDAFFGYDIRDSIGSTGISHVDNLVVSAASIPEPSSFALLAGGLSLLIVGGRRRSTGARS